ncbi:hypothetical protein DHOM_05010 [Dermabacter hominis 1368]|uniref:Uncharacterized protein n=1 Tax=Dermabacter hominis 1368 TaxID=1450519 RepID=A0ABR4SK59_9MICO|nr:hypothetical protein DHOM_05010 [Dermabacter hominis 1368]
MCGAADVHSFLPPFAKRTVMFAARVVMSR